MTDTDSIKIPDDQHPYLGLDSFQEEFKEYFFGRNKEIETLYSLVRNNIITIIFGSSGLGKTSLLNAGLFPKLRENYYLPIYIRIHFDDLPISPIEQTKIEILKQIKKIDKKVIPINGLTFWEYFHQLEILKGLVTPLLVFDQFEEIFTAGKSNKQQINDFITEITDLIENQVPVSVQEKFENKEIPFSFHNQKYRVIFSLREEYLPQLEKWNDLIPSIKKSRFRVSQMNRDQALEAITLPGKEIIDSSEANKILDLISAEAYPGKSINLQDQEFEPFLLSLICEQINELRLRKKHVKITSGLLEKIEIEDIIKNLYQESTNDLERIAIEDHLLTIDGYRNFQVLDDIYKKYNLTDDNIEKLIKQRIIRQETRNNIVYIELIHDVLVRVVKESRDRRREEEKKLAEQTRIEEEVKTRKKELKFEYAWKIGFLISVLLLVAIVLGFIAWNQRNEAITQKAKTVAALSRYQREKDPTFSLRLTEAAYMIDPIAYDELLTAYQYGPYYDIRIRHEKGVRTVEISPNGKFIVFINEADTLARLFNLESNKQIKLIGHKYLVKTAKFSPNGKYIVTASFDSTARVWNLDGEELSVLRDHKGTLNYAEFSRNGKYVITASNDNTARLWDWEEKKSTELVGHNNFVRIARFSPDSQTVITGSKDKTARVWNLDGEQLDSLDGHESGVNSIEFSHSGDSLITITDNKIARIWNISGREDPIVINWSDEKIEIAKFTPDDKAIVIVSVDSMKLWPLPFKGESKIHFKGHTEKINSIEFSADSQFIITASNDKTARLWDLQGNLKEILLGHQEPVISAHFAGNDLNIVTTSWDNTSRFWKLDRGKSQNFKVDRKTSIGLTINAPKEYYVFTTDTNNTVHLWNKEGIDTIKLKGHKDFVSSVAFSADGKFIVTASFDGTARIWDENGKELYPPLKGHKHGVKSAEFSQDGKYIVTAGSDNTARIWSRNGIAKDTLDEHTRYVSSASFSPNGKYVVTASGDSTVRLWDLNGEDSRVYVGHNRPVESAKFSSDGNYIITACADSTARLLDMDLNELIIFKGGEIKVKSAQFSPDGNSILIYSGLSKVRLWNLEGDSLHTFTEQGGTVSDVGFSWNGDYVIIAHANGNVWRWPIEPEVIKALINDENENNRIWELDSDTKENIGIE